MFKETLCGFSETSQTLPLRPAGDPVPGPDLEQPSLQNSSGTGDNISPTPGAT